MNSNVITSSSFTSKDLLLRKLYYSIVSSVFSQLALLLVYVLLSNINILHPIDWVLSTLKTFTSLTTWLFVIPFITLVFAQSIICAKDYVFKSSYCSTRFQKFISIFSVHNIVLLALNIIVGTTSVWLFSSLGGTQYQYLTRNCKGQSYCLNEGSFFLICSGFWTGFYYFMKIYLSEKHLSFPVIQQKKLLQFKSQLLPFLKESFSSSIWPMVYFLCLYRAWGNSLSESFCSFFGLGQEESSDSPMIYFYLWMFGALFHFNMKLMRFFFNLFLTEPIEFPLCKISPDSLSLQEGIMISDLPIIQNLACLDLSTLSRWSKHRRQVLFTLSHPGGHPHNWNILTENLLKLLTAYSELLSKSTDTAETIKTPAPVTYQSPIQSPGRFRNLRNMSLMSDRGIADIVDVTHAPLAGLSVPNTLFHKLTQKINNTLEVLKVVFGINFIFGELPQANIQKCLANGLIIIWSSQGISDLVCASIEEDRFGIVQKDLPAIITALVHLKQNLDKLNKVPALTKKIAGYDDFNYKMKGAISGALKRSLFNICRTFGKFLGEFPLNKDVVLYLQTIYKS
ncbi:unnamed protein product [Phaedon cochleariae]|uniref:Nucleoporin NDC1 n=1 Tax=Phaedon cochleariae TaxID=80249 RepID=A0A9P0GQE8_PHACE|nr:unnamed protein product [Phaedon cochleariae]